MTLALIVTCVQTPLSIAFQDRQTESQKLLDDIIDLLFFLDIIVIFNSAFYDEENEIIDERK